jgi:hypothetical protein
VRMLANAENGANSRRFFMQTIGSSATMTPSS